MEILTINEQRTDKEWTKYLAIMYAEGFCEGEDATELEKLEAYAIITKYKYYTQLQGFFGRTIQSLVDSGLMDWDGNINWEEYDNRIK